MKLLHNYLLIKPIQKETNNVSGIILTDDNFSYGKVVEVGRGELNDKGEYVPINISIDDVVMYKRGADTPVVIDGESYILISDLSVIMIK